MHFYTSINNNYFAKARVLAKSVKKYNPSAKFTLILADQLIDKIDIHNEPFDEILTLQELGFKDINLNLWTYIHTVVELCTAIKGQALVKFLEEGSGKVIYLDPDIVVFKELGQLDSLLNDHDIILTPHQTAPEHNKMDVMNNEICSLKHGTYNFGFFAVNNSENGIKFARWWRDRLLDFCFDDIPNGLFTDQKWGDLVPALFNGVHILRCPSYNVSTWNLTNRKVSCEDGQYLVNGIPLNFYHFSGFDSGAQEQMLNLYGEKNEALFSLRQWYIKKQEEEGQSKFCKISSIYDFYSNGKKIRKEERALLRDRADVYEYFKEINPYIVDQEKSFCKWVENEEISNGLFVDTITLLEKEKQETLNSISWKITEPLRVIGRLLKRN